jgi:hypothetical protein
VPNNPYSTSTVDTPSCKQLVCGRTDDLQAILRLLSEGKSIALFGERRIGKTLTLWLLRDIITNSIRAYQDGLWDAGLRTWLATLKRSSARTGQRPTECKYITLHDINKKAIDGIIDELRKKFPPAKGDKAESLQEFFGRINAGRATRLVILIDEMEVLLDAGFGQADLVFRQLRSVIQSCAQISFVFSGAEHWVRAIKDVASPLAGNCSSVFLAIPDSAAIAQFLLKDPMAAYIPSDIERSNVVARIMQETGGKPFYCQAIAQEMAYGKPLQEALRETLKGYKKQIEDFFGDPPEPGPSILGLLAHKSPISKKMIASFLGLSEQKAASALDDMEALGKIRAAEGFYSLNGRLLESWGRANLEPPKTKSAWQSRLRWVAVAVFAIIAIYTYIYTHPQHREYKLPINGGAVVLILPSSVENGETGKASLCIDAGKDSIASLVIVPMADSMQHAARIWPETGNAWSFSNLVPGQTSARQSAEFKVSHEARGKTVVFKFHLNHVQPVKCHVPLRRFPLKAYWAIFSGLAAVFAALAATWKLVHNLAVRFMAKN